MRGVAISGEGAEETGCGIRENVLYDDIFVFI